MLDPANRMGCTAAGFRCRGGSYYTPFRLFNCFSGTKKKILCYPMDKKSMYKLLLTLLFSAMLFSLFAERKVSGLQSGTWEASHQVYIVEGDIIVPKGLTLTIEPGVIVKFNGYYGLRVDGNLVAKGTREKPIIFTSFTDDYYGGDSNKDGIESGPTPMDWAGVKISNQNSRSLLRNTRILYSLMPLNSAAGDTRIDSLYLEGNSAARIIVKSDTINIVEKRPYSLKRKNVKAQTAQKKAIKKDGKSSGNKKKFWIGLAALGTTGTAAAVWFLTQGEEPPADNSGLISDPPAPPSP